jgi:hypothetical protein
LPKRNMKLNNVNCLKRLKLTSTKSETSSKRRSREKRRRNDD